MTQQDYTVAVQGDDYRADTATTGRVAVGGSTTGVIEVGGDSDWFRASPSPPGSAPASA